MTEIKYIKTSDVDLAATLLTLNIPIDGIYSTGKTNYLKEQVMEFYFRDTVQIRSFIDDYKFKKLRVEPKLLLINRREIINRMKEEQFQ